MEIAQSHQVLFFTCHPHTVALFREACPDLPVVTVDSGRLVKEELVGSNRASRF